MDFQIPSWLIGALPVINYLLNQIIIKVGGDAMSGDDKRNMVTAVSIAIVGALALFGVVPAPAGPEGGLLSDWAPHVLALGAWLWGGAKALHDMLDALGTAAGGGSTA